MAEVTSVFSPNQYKPGKTRIMLAEDHPLLRQALRNVLEKEHDFEVIAEASDGEEAVKLATKLIPDVVIMDISMPNLNGLEATRQIKASCPTIAILVLTVYDDNEHIFGILQAGAGGYLTKCVYGDEVINAVRAVVCGETVLSPLASQQLLKYVFQHIRKPLSLDAGDKVTAREMEILRLAAMGISNKDIALRLGLSLRTVKGYLADLFLKLNVASRTEAVIVGLRKGIVTLDDLE
ncbi:response regulator transcription factor [Dehalococcoidia bacterium]|nr:response regulator transcription factor [Dehalococcoidia bacterium]